VRKLLTGQASPPAPLRLERGVVCEVTPIGLVIGGDGCRTYGGHVGVTSVITPSPFGEGLGVRPLLVVMFCVIG